MTKSQSQSVSPSQSQSQTASRRWSATASVARSVRHGKRRLYELWVPKS
jgi:hypothetical protein